MYVVTSWKSIWTFFSRSSLVTPPHALIPNDLSPLSPCTALAYILFSHSSPVYCVFITILLILISHPHCSSMIHYIHPYPIYRCNLFPTSLTLPQHLFMCYIHLTHFLSLSLSLSIGSCNLYLHTPAFSVFTDFYLLCTLRVHPNTLSPLYSSHQLQLPYPSKM